jgi:nucleolar pre-ribosomal-associated protein 2
MENYILIHKQAWVIMQYNVDETLTAVALSSSPNGPKFFTENTDDAFLRLCNLIRTVLSLHRRRIRGGRYHLVIAALQSLLHCIFKRKPASQRKKSDKVVHPPWLLPSSSSSPLPPKLTDKSIDYGFNRLLSTFCEPSVSSVRSRSNASLVDSEREREKREVAAYVGPLLGEVLKGGLAGGFEGNIDVGVGAIFAILGAEGVKVFARSVDKEGRAMLREMWDEYRRVGGGGPAERW